MSDDIEVKVTAHAGRKFFIMYYDDPITGKREQRSTKKTKRSEAVKEAGKWQAELREGRYRRPTLTTWDEFRQQFFELRLASAPKKTRGSYETALNAVERHVKVNRLSELSSAKITHVADQLASVDKVSPETVRSYLSHLRGSLNWAHGRGMINAVPSFRMAKRAKGASLAKGRAIVLEEFERMLTKIEAGIVLAATRERKEPRKREISADALARYKAAIAMRAAAVADDWHRLLRGLWLSGLRLGEALNLSWDDETKILADFSGRRPMLRIVADQQKAKRDTLLPMTPDFAEFLLETPKDQRQGPVFPLPVSDLNHISKVISSIGEAAGVVVDKEDQKYASAHDLRRAFGYRWSARVMPAVLKELMRHTDISTTMKYYVTQNAEQTADVLWNAMPKSSSVGTSVGINEKSPADVG